MKHLYNTSIITLIRCRKSNLFSCIVLLLTFLFVATAGRSDNMLPQDEGNVTFVNVSGSVTFPIGNDISNLSQEFSDGITETSFYIGENLSSTGEKTVLDEQMTGYRPDKSYAGTIKGVMLEFLIKTKAGVSFTPNSVSYNAVKGGTNQATYSWSYTVDGVESAITQVPNDDIVRNNNSTGVPAMLHTHNINTTGCTTFTFRIYVSGVGDTKDLFINKVVISGTLNGTIQSGDIVGNKVCYLLGSDGELAANHASATLTEVSEGVYEGEVTYSGQFYVSKKLAKSADDWTSIDNDVWTGSTRSGRILSVGEAFWMTQGYSNIRSTPMLVNTEGTYKTTVDFNKGTILIEDTGTPGPGPGPDPQPTSYINEESKGGCYLLFWAGRNYMDETIFSYTQPSATLNETETKGVFDGYVKFDRSSFTITRALATTEIDIEEDSEKYYKVLKALRPYRFGALEHPISFDSAIGMEENLESPQDFWMREYDPTVTYYVKVDFNTRKMAVCTSKDKDPLQSQTDVVYLIGTDGVMDASHASATLAKVSDGVYEGEVTYSNQFFYVTKKLAKSDDWASIDNYVWAGNQSSGRVLNVGEPLTMSRSYSEWGNIPFRVAALGTYKTTVNLKDETILIEDPNGSDNPNVPDIDLSSGAHFSITLTQPGTLKQRLTNAVFQTDYDLVDFLTIKGKMGGADIAYLRAQEGLVSQLQYLDISQVELVYDDEVYYTYTYQTNWGSFGGFQTYQTNVYTLSSENKEEAGGGSFSGVISNTTTIYRRNDLTHAFSGMRCLTQCKLPLNLPAVGQNVLNNCPLNKVALPTAPAYIGDYAFNSTQLKSIDLPASVDSLGISCFQGTPLMAVDISHVSRLGAYCFASTALKSFELNSGVKEMPEGLFSGCSKLTEVTIPNTVKTLGASLFADCNNLATVEIGNGITTISNNAFDSCDKLTTVTMGNAVKKINSRAFYNCDKLSNVTISANIEEIGHEAFSSNNGNWFVPWLENLATDGGVKYIGKVAYKHISGADINIKEGTVSLADNFINGSVVLKTITLPSTLRIMGNECLSNSGISSIDLPESLEKIGVRALAAWDGKLRRITIPRNVSYIGEEAFRNGSNLIRVIYNAENATIYNENGEVKPDNEICQIFTESVTRLIINEGVKKIPSSMFSGCKNLIRVQMPSTVESIGNGAFSGCNNLEHIDLPSSLTYMGTGNFDNLTSVTSYLKNPGSLIEPPTEEEILNSLDLEEWDNPAGFGGWISKYTPFGYVEYRYDFDAEGKIHVTGPTIPSSMKRIPLLQVPSESVAAYQSDGFWSVSFEQIVSFEGASDAETIVESTSVKLADNVTDETDLSGTLVDGIYVTLDTEDSGDGYDATEGCIVINSQTTEEGVAAASADNADDLTVKNQLNGLMFEIPPGKGRITIDCQTLGSRALYIKIGDNDPQAVSLSTRNTVTFNFDVLMATRVLIYAANNTQGNHNNSKRRVAYANDDSVKLYGLSISIDELDEDGINTPTPDVSEGERIIYDLSGRKVTNGLKKGLYIVNGKKVIRLYPI